MRLRALVKQMEKQARLDSVVVLILMFGKDYSGTVLKIDSNITGTSEVSGLAPGIYTVDVSNNGVCGDMSAQIEISQPDPVISDFDSPESASLNGDSISFVNHSINALSYFWEFGDGHNSSLKSPKAQIQFNRGIYC